MDPRGGGCMVSKNVYIYSVKLPKMCLSTPPPQEKSGSAHEMAFNLFSVDAFQFHARVFHQNSTGQSLKKHIKAWHHFF